MINLGRLGVQLPEPVMGHYRVPLLSGWNGMWGAVLAFLLLLIAMSCIRIFCSLNILTQTTALQSQTQRLEKGQPDAKSPLQVKRIVVLDLPWVLFFI